MATVRLHVEDHRGREEYGAPEPEQRSERQRISRGRECDLQAQRCACSGTRACAVPSAGAAPSCTCSRCGGLCDREAVQQSAAHGVQLQRQGQRRSGTSATESPVLSSSYLKRKWKDDIEIPRSQSWCSRTFACIFEYVEQVLPAGSKFCLHDKTFTVAKSWVSPAPEV